MSLFFLDTHIEPLQPSQYFIRQPGWSSGATGKSKRGGHGMYTSTVIFYSTISQSSANRSLFEGDHTPHSRRRISYRCVDDR